MNRSSLQKQEHRKKLRGGSNFIYVDLFLVRVGMDQLSRAEGQNRHSRVFGGE